MIFAKRFRDYMATGKKPTDEIVEDAAPKHKGEVRYLIDCNDRDGYLFDLIKYIAKNGNGGHSFSIVVDPGSDGEKKFFWDGDGSDHIRSVTKCEKDDDIVGLLMANIRAIEMMAYRALPKKDYPGDKTDDPIESLKRIEATCDAVLRDDIRGSFATTEELCKLIIEKCSDYRNGKVEGNSNWTIQDSFDHIKEICEDHLKKMKDVTKESDDKKN